ncbi:MAG: cytochrome c biogenesis CcdA family protein [Chloroflexota bacterium]
MEAESVNLIVALVAGVLSFASPCVLPLVPGYLTFLAGTAVEGPPSRLRLLLNAAAFVAGFTTVFVLLGALAGLVGYALQPYVPLLRQLGGVVLIVLGLHTAGVLRIPLLYRQWQPGNRLRLGFGRATSFVVGMVFAFGWTPCVGPVLGGILVLASTSETAGQGALLLVVYSLGMGIPFLGAGLAADALSGWLKQANRHMRLVEVISGALLVAMGVLVFTGELARLSALLYPTG